MNEMKHVIGLDLSLSTTGVAHFREGSEHPACGFVSVAPPGPDATVSQELARMSRMASGVITRVADLISDSEAPDIWFVFEGPAHQASYGKAHERAGLWWIIAVNLATRYPAASLIAVPPATLKSYWTGKGNAAKEVMFERAKARYPQLFIRDHNVADGLALAHAGAKQRGLLPSLHHPEVYLSALHAVRWPQPQEANE